MGSEPNFSLVRSLCSLQMRGTCWYSVMAEKAFSRHDRCWMTESTGMAMKHSPAVNLMVSQSGVREHVRARWKYDAGDLIDAHNFAFSALASMSARFSGRRFKEQSKSIEGRMSLAAQFIQGIDICETSISEGLYSQAAALLKQELETLAAIDEFEIGRRKDGRTPNIGNGIMSGFGRVYGDLNNIAHVSQHELARQLVTIEQGEICAPSLVPHYNGDHARFLYGYHVYFIIEVTNQVSRIFEEIFSEGLSKEEGDWAFCAMMILLKEKVIELPPEVKKRFPNISFDKFTKR